MAIQLLSTSPLAVNGQKGQLTTFDAHEISTRQDVLTSISSSAGVAGSSGDTVNLSEELSEPVRKVLERLPSSAPIASLAKHLSENENLLALAQDLSDKELGQLSNVVESMKALPAGVLTSNGVEGEIDRLTQTLGKLDGVTRARVLETAQDFTVSIQDEPSPEDSRDMPYGDQAPQRTNRNDALFALVHAVDQAEDPALFLNKLEGFEPGQQKTLVVMASEGMGAEKVMDALREKSGETRELAFKAIDDLVGEYRKGPPRGTPQAVTVSIADKFGTGLVLTQADYDNHGKDTLKEMVGSMADMMAHYEFSDDQLQQMMGQVQGMDRSDQRAFLQITEVGLETLLGSSNLGPIDMTEHEEELALVDDIRSNDRARELVFMSRMGESRVYEGALLYEKKDPSDITRDVENAVKVLTMDAWASQQLGEEEDTGHTMMLSDHLMQLDATDRDEMVARMARMSWTEMPPGQMPPDEAEDVLTDFHTMTNALAAGHFPEDLMVAQEESPETAQDTFWQIAEMAGTKVDQMADIILDTPKLGAYLMEQLEVVAQLVDQQPDLREKAEEKVSELISQFSKLAEDSDEEPPRRPERNPWPISMEDMALNYTAEYSYSGPETMTA